MRDDLIYLTGSLRHTREKGLGMRTMGVWGLKKKSFNPSERPQWLRCGGGGGGENRPGPGAGGGEA